MSHRFTDQKLDTLYESSKFDNTIFIGSDIRMLVGELRDWRKHATGPLTVRLLDNMDPEPTGAHACLAEVIGEDDRDMGSYVNVLWRKEDEIKNLIALHGHQKMYKGDFVVCERRAELLNDLVVWKPILLCAMVPAAQQGGER